MSPPAGAAEHPAPLIGAEKSTAIDGSYIVVMKGNGAKAKADAADARALAKKKGGSVKFAYDKAITGFSATLDTDALDALRADPDVDYVEANQVVKASGDQANPTWGIDRTDDIGEIVFNMIEAKLLSKTEADNRADFHQVYDLDKALADGYTIAAPPLERAKRGER